MKRIITLVMIMMASLSWGISSSYAQCPDTSYVSFKVTIGSSDCAPLSDCAYVYIVFYYQGTSTILWRDHYSQYQDTYIGCIQGPITSGQICATLLILPPGSCTGMNLSCTPSCSGFQPSDYPYWGSKQSGPYPLPILDDYCLN